MRVCVNTICIILDNNNSKSILDWIANLGNSEEDSYLMDISTQINTISISSGTIDSSDGMISHNFNHMSILLFQ
jgi:hypothetical protein